MEGNVQLVEITPRYLPHRNGSGLIEFKHRQWVFISFLSLCLRVSLCNVIFTQLERRHEQMKRNLEAQYKELEEKRRVFEDEKANWEAQQKILEQQKLDASKSVTQVNTHNGCILQSSSLIDSLLAVLKYFCTRVLEISHHLHLKHVRSNWNFLCATEIFISCNIRPDCSWTSDTKSVYKRTA